MECANEPSKFRKKIENSINQAEKLQDYLKEVQIQNYIISQIL